MIRVALVDIDCRDISWLAGVAGERGRQAGFTITDAASADVVVCPPSAASLAVLRKLSSGRTAGPAALVVSEPPLASRFLELRLRAHGILPPTATNAAGEAALRALAEGLSVGALGSFAGIARHDDSLPDQDGAIQSPLTAREVDVLRGLAGGLANKQIARALSISAHTVKFHTSSIYQKLAVTNRAQAVAAGIRAGLLEV